MKDMDSEKSYLEIKVTFVHIIVLLVAVIGIGIFLFYLGFQAGKSSLSDRISSDELRKGVTNTQEIKIADDLSQTPSKGQEKENSIDKEIRLHQQPVHQDKAPQTTKRTTPKKQTTASVTPKKITARPARRDPYYVVQVGAFENHQEAKSYSDKFSKMRYPTEIQKTIVRNVIMFRVLVGNYSSKELANREVKTLQKLAGRTGFFVKRMN
jgi:cell division septation protein DedD